MDIQIYSAEMQGVGGFDGGKIIEQKPIGFPHERSAVKRVGPLFYWAWAKAEVAGHIPSHPHQGFEIMTYVIQGKAEHKDSLGTTSTVGCGGAQVMQTGSGVWHEEGFIGPQMEGFQIWFEPDLRKSTKKQPTYHQYEHEDFPIDEQVDYICKTIIGVNSPVDLETSVQMWDLTLQSTKTFRFELLEHHSLALLAIRGNGLIQPEKRFHQTDFIVAHADKTEELVVQNTGQEVLRCIVIEVPTKVDYPLYER